MRTDGRTDRPTDMMKPTVALRGLTNAPKKSQREDQKHDVREKC